MGCHGAAYSGTVWSGKTPAPLSRPGVWTTRGGDAMAERTGPVQAQHRAGEQAVQTAYTAFIHHTQACTECRTGGMDCTDAAELRQAWRHAREQVAA